MSKVEEIERAVEKPSPEETAAFGAWLEDYRSDAWDRQIEADAKAGRLDWLADEARAHEAASRARGL